MRGVLEQLRLVACDRELDSKWLGRVGMLKCGIFNSLVGDACGWDGDR